MEQYGIPTQFNPDQFFDVVEQLIMSDEIISAMKMLDLLPSYYRKNLPKRATEIRDQIYQNTWTLHDYCSDSNETYDNALACQNKLYFFKKWSHLSEIFDSPFAYPRSRVILDLVEKYNKDGKVPNICELGPSNFWLPYGLKASGMKFKYNGNSIQYQAQTDHKERLADHWYETSEEKTDIFICFEVIEHLWEEKDIMHFYKRKKIDAEHVLLSTPLNTLEGGRANWKQKDIGHLRAYNEDDFMKIASEMFPGRQWALYRSQLMVLEGKKI